MLKFQRICLRQFSQKKILTDEQIKEGLRPILMKEGYFEDEQYLYYIDRDSRIRKVPREYQKRDGVYRIKFLEPIYRWWIRRSPDTQFAIIPYFLSAVFFSIIYNGANFIIEREDQIAEKAKVDPNFNKENLEKWRNEKQKEK
ncbi:unnamed protein product [Paramecium pentaurelia]|uniref:Uncharacterized protein n=1 Tax=Paramecium pentaurelia TaxID=43138 RepID=A0A8S1V5M9_9CILI|nr:unnamed protein product [Paramecium pentaurelia]